MNFVEGETFVLAIVADESLLCEGSVSGGGDLDDARALKLTGAIHTVPAGLGYGLLAMNALWHRLLLRFEIRQHPPSNLQSILCVLFRSSGVSIEQDTVDLEHAVVWCVWGGQILPLLEGGARRKTLGFRTDVDGGLVVTVHTKDSRAAQNTSANVAHDGAVLEVLIRGGGDSWFIVNVLDGNTRQLDRDQ